MTLRARRCLGRPALLAVLTLLLLVVPATDGRAWEREMAPSFGLELGYYWPQGSWKEHRFAEGVDQFQGGFHLHCDFEAGFLGVNWVLYGSYTRFRMSDWIAYAAENGDDIAASASAYGSGLLARFYLGRNSPSFFHVDFGFGYQRLSAEESFAGYTYQYNFLVDDAGFVLGLGFKRLLSPQLALSVSAKALLVLEGVRYADGQKHDVFGMPLTAGIKYIF